MTNGDALLSAILATGNHDLFVLACLVVSGGSEGQLNIHQFGNLMEWANAELDRQNETISIQDHLT